MARRTYHPALAAFGLLTVAITLTGCLGEGAAPHLKPIPAAAQARLAKLGMTQKAPILVRIFKQEAELEIWKKKDNGRFHLFKTYPICNFSGDLGPKLKQGDKQAPEGFYTVRPAQMNPNSDFHLSFNLGYPNVYDAAHNRTGAHLMVHGDCSSAGCYAMTDALIEEIYAIAREAFEGGQRAFHVHAFPFRMTEENMIRHRDNRWYGFWQTLKAGYDAFEKTRVQPRVTVCEKRYVVNAEFLGDVAKPDPKKACPPHRKLDAATILARLERERSVKAAQSKPSTATHSTKTAESDDTVDTAEQESAKASDNDERRTHAVSVISKRKSHDGADEVAAEAATTTTSTESEAAISTEPWVVPEDIAETESERETRNSTPDDGSAS